MTSNYSSNAAQTPIIGKARAQLLSQVYAMILSPDWEKSDASPKTELKQYRNQKQKKTNQDDC